jgi:DNA-binding CsgD family transcriptional regulator
MADALYEREAVLQGVRRLLDAAFAGRGGTVFVVAPAGLGKTSVLDAAVREARTRFDVRIGRADAVEATLPYGLIGQSIGDDPGLGDGELIGDVPAATRYFATLRRVQRLAADRPLLLAFDDLHWSDPDSLTLVHLLCRRAPGLAVAVLATARPWPDAALRMAEQLSAHALVDIQRLAPLSDQAARAVLRDRFGELDYAAVERAVAACDGNPLLLELAGPQEDAGAAPTGGVPTRRLLLARFAAADQAAQGYLRAASALGVRFRPAIAAAIADLTSPLAAGVVEDLVRADLLREDDEGGLRFRHALLRQAIYDDLPAPTRAYLHERAFRMLLTAGVAPAEAAEHAVAADLPGDGQAIATLADAGRAALHAGAVHAARRHLEAAVRLAGEGAAGDLQVTLARALLGGGASHDAATVLDRVLTRPDLSVAARLRAQLLRGQAAFNTGATQQAGGWFEAVAKEAGPDHPGAAIRALLAHALQSWARHGPRAALPMATRARRLATSAEPYLRACADSAWALCTWQTGDPAALGVAEAASCGVPPPASAADSANWGFDPAAVPADIAVWSERFPLAERLFADALRTAERRAQPFLLFHAALSQSDMLVRLGRLTEAAAMADRACDAGELLPVGLPLARAAKGLALVESGRLAEAERYVEPPDPAWHLAVGYQLRLRGTLAHRRGRLDIACQTFDELETRSREWGLADPSSIAWAAEAIDAHLAACRFDHVERLVGWLSDCPLPSRWPKATAAAGRGVLAARHGDLDLAEESLAEAVDLLQDVPMPLAQSRVLNAHGTVLIRQGRPHLARPVLAEALRLAEGCGAAWHVERAAAQLRRAGGRAGRLPPGRLSPQEKAVARLARTGRTNRQIAEELFLSVNTVETHLAHAYRKLGISRRRELTDLNLD